MTIKEMTEGCVEIAAKENEYKEDKNHAESIKTL